MRWFRIRTADIPEGDRELFERYGATVIGAILAGSSPRGAELKSIPDEKRQGRYSCRLAYRAI
jgi:hypothetical protein